MKTIKKKTLNFFNLITRNFTKANIITGILSVTFIGVIKYSGFPAVILNYLNIDQSNMREYLVAGFLGLNFRLGIKGIVEEYLNS